MPGRLNIEKGACGHRQVSGDHSGGMGHSIEDTQDRDRRREVTGVACCTPPLPNPQRGQDTQSKRVSGLGVLIWCVSVCIQDHRNPEARLCLLYLNAKAFGGVSVI